MISRQRTGIVLAGLLGATVVALADVAHAEEGRTSIPPAPIPLAPVGDNRSSEARAINAWGEVVGLSFDDVPIATIWDRRGRPWPLAPLAGDSGSEAFAINDWGEVAGDSSGAITSAVRWNPHAPLTRLAPPEGDLESFARGINARGEVAGYSASRNHAASDNGVLVQAVRWNADGEPTVLPPLEGDLEAMALAINDRSEVAGYSFNPGGRDTAVAWNRRGVPRALLPLLVGQGSEAHAINRQGTVAGDSQNGVETPTLWVRAKATVLPPLPPDPDGLAFAINDKGITAGVSISEGSLHTAVRWRRGARPLRLPALPGDDRSWARGINGHGDVVGFSAGEAGTTAVLWPAFGKPQHGNKRMAHHRRLGR
ncbi:MAG: hypothetical protein ACREJ0_14840 [Geminicoccaceae bacterium]